MRHELGARAVRLRGGDRTESTGQWDRVWVLTAWGGTKEREGVRMVPGGLTWGEVASGLVS